MKYGVQLKEDGVHIINSDVDKSYICYIRNNYKDVLKVAYTMYMITAYEIEISKDGFIINDNVRLYKNPYTLFPNELVLKCGGKVVESYYGYFIGKNDTNGNFLFALSKHCILEYKYIENFGYTLCDTYYVSELWAR